jgi:hypothetical protein
MSLNKCYSIFLNRNTWTQNEFCVAFRQWHSCLAGKAGFAKRGNVNERQLRCMSTGGWTRAVWHERTRACVGAIV